MPFMQIKGIKIYIKSAMVVLAVLMNLHIHHVKNYFVKIAQKNIFKKMLWMF